MLHIVGNKTPWKIHWGIRRAACQRCHGGNCSSPCTVLEQV